MNGVNIIIKRGNVGDTQTHTHTCNDANKYIHNFVDYCVYFCNNKFADYDETDEMMALIMMRMSKLQRFILRKYSSCNYYLSAVCFYAHTQTHNIFLVNI